MDRKPILSVKLGVRVKQLVALGLFAAVAAGPVQSLAAGPAPVTDLGKPTNIVSTQSYYPLGGYRHEGKPLHRGSRLEALFLGEQVTDLSAAVEWPFVKALGQFGTFRSVTELEGVCGRGPVSGSTICGIAGFDLDHARYASRYVAFVYRDLEDRSGQCHAKLPTAEMALVRRNHINFYTPDPRHPCWYLSNSINGPYPPLVAVGGYVETGPSQIPVVGDFQRAIPPAIAGMSYTYTGLPFADIQNALITQKDPPSSYVVEHVNSEANIITTLICHADGMEPRSVCDRSVIKRIMKNVK